MHFFWRDRESGGVNNRKQAGAEIVDRKPANVLGVQPDGFGIESFVRRRGGLLEIHHGVGAVDAFEGKHIDQFLARHLFAIVFWRPAQQAQKIDEGFRKESGVAVGGDADHRTVAPLGELRSVGRDKQRKMRELRRRGARAFENEHVLVGVREMILAADDVADTEIDVVRTRGEVVGGHAVGAEQRKVFDIVSGLDLLAVDRVREADLLAVAARNTEAKGEGLSGRGSAVAFGAGKFAHAGVEEPGLTGAGLFAVPSVGGCEVAVSQALLEDRVCDLAMQGHAFGLLVFLVPSEVEPAQTVEDGIDGGVGVALDIGVIEPQDHGSPVVTSVEPVEDEGASAANVQKTRGRRSESNAKHNL